MRSVKPAWQAFPWGFSALVLLLFFLFYCADVPKVKKAQNPTEMLATQVNDCEAQLNMSLNILNDDPDVNEFC